MIDNRSDTLTLDAEEEVRRVVRRCIQDAYTLGFTSGWPEDPSDTLDSMEEEAVLSIWLALSAVEPAAGEES